MASMTIRKKWYGKIQQISDTETRKESLWAILEYIAGDNIDPLRRPLMMTQHAGILITWC